MAPIIPANDATPGLAAPAPMPVSTLGTRLRQARLAKDKTITQAAARLRIKAAFLEALEDGDETALPGHVYALGFVRSYADFLDLDPEQAVEDFKREAENLAHHTELTFPAPPTPRPSSGMPLLVAVAALGLAAAAGWFVTKSDNSLVAEGIPTPPGLSTAGQTVSEPPAPDVPAATAPQPAPHIAATLLDIARTDTRTPRPTESTTATTPATAQPAITTPPAIQQAALSPAPTAAPAITPTIPSEPVPWPAYVLPLDMLNALQQQAATAQAPPPVPVQRPAHDIAAASTKRQQQQFAVAATALDLPPAPVSTPAPEPTATATLALSDAAPADPIVLAPAVDDAIALVEDTTEEISAPVMGEFSTAAAASAPDASNHETPVPESPAARPTVERAHIPAIPPSHIGTGGSHVYGQVNRDARIILAAQSDIWIQIRDQNQNELFTRLLRAGESYRVPNRPGLFLFTGNAGGLKVTVDGQLVAALGNAGAVRRDVALNADQLLATSLQ